MANDKTAKFSVKDFNSLELKELAAKLNSDQKTTGNLPFSKTEKGKTSATMLEIVLILKEKWKDAVAYKAPPVSLKKIELNFDGNDWFSTAIMKMERMGFIRINSYCTEITMASRWVENPEIYENLEKEREKSVA